MIRGIEGWLGFVVTSAAMLVGADGAVRYVDRDAVGSGSDGASWATAFTNLQDALAVAESGDEIWVAEGVYYPDTGAGQTADDPASTFMLKTGVSVFGGFEGDEGSAGERDAEVHVAVLSGDIDHETNPDLNTSSLGVLTESPAANVQGDNANHVVTSIGLDSTSVLDGFTVTAGYADGSFPSNRGGGIYNSEGSSPSISRCMIVGNFAATTGGGVYNHDDSNPDITRCFVTGNGATDGAGIYNSDRSHPALTSCWIERNTASMDGGGVYNFDGSDPVFVNCSVSWNTAASAGGGIFNLSGSKPILVNCTVARNAAGVIGGGIINFGSSDLHLTNVLVWANTESGSSLTDTASIFWDSGLSGSTIGHSLIARINPSGTNNLNGVALASARMFVIPDTLRLDVTSPAVGAGLGSVTVPGSDLAGSPRFNGQIDIGAFEVPADLNGDGIPDGYEELYEVRGDVPVPYPDSDDDGDGLRAVEEFVFGQNPDSPDSADLGAGVAPGESGNFLTLTYPRHRDAVEHVAISVLRSSDLGRDDPWAVDETTEVSVVPSAGDPDIELVTVRSTVPADSQTHEFLKLEITLAPE